MSVVSGLQKVLPLKRGKLFVFRRKYQFKSSLLCLTQPDAAPVPMARESNIFSD